MGSAVLGLNFGTHDAAAALVIDGAVAAAAEEDRFTRVKQTKAFPAHAITYCLNEAGIDAADIEKVALFVDPRLQLVLPLANLRHAFPASLGSLWSDFDKYRRRRLAPAEIYASDLVPRSAVMVPVRHHLAHAASAYLTSPFDEATVVTLDGRGEYETACAFHGRGRALRRRHSVSYPHSVGYLYSMFTRYLGFRPQRDEYKVMGLAGYGGPTYNNTVADLAAFNARTGRLRLDLAYFDHHRRPSPARQLYSPRLTTLLGPARQPDEPITDRHRDIAHAVQKLTETLVLAYVRHARTLAPSRNLCLAGGVALNGVANAAVITSGLFDHVFVQPAANDAGTSLGAALLVEGHARAPMANAFLGPRYGQAAISQAARAAAEAGCTITPSTDPATDAARLLAADQIIGWFHGRMEFGPRALGSRSILAHPGNRANTQRVNALIKRREGFRPLAPAVLEEHADDYFHLHSAGRHVYPFMLATSLVREGKRAQIPAVVHVDASARVQTVARQHNPEFWRLIHAFHRTTGVPLVLNTSFNDADEPIVCTPADAVRTFLACGLDSLVLENLVISRPAAHR